MRLGALYVLAAAYGELGRFAEAISTAERAIRAARTDDEGFIDTVRRSIELYRQEKPFRSDVQ